jgi:hypothetical protein
MSPSRHIPIAGIAAAQVAGIGRIYYEIVRRDPAFPMAAGAATASTTTPQTKSWRQP